MSLHEFCLIVSLVLALIAAWPPASARVALFPLAFAFFIASLLFGGVVIR